MKTADRPAWKRSGAQKEIVERADHGGYTMDEIDEISDDVALWARLHGKVPDLVTREALPFIPRPLQRRMFAHYRHCLQLQIPCWMVVCKIRRGGGSIAAEAILYAHGRNHNARMGAVGTTDDVSQNMFLHIHFLAANDDFPGWSKPTKVLDGDGKIEWNNGTSWEKYTASNPEAARSAGLQSYHACVPGDTPVIMADGHVRQIREILEGERVLTHTGAVAIVTAITGKVNRKGSLVKITPWSGGAISMTKDHKVWTRRGLIRGDEVTMDDWVSLPVRPIIGGASPLILPASKPRKQSGGRMRAQAGMTIPFNRETGFFFGYYLAEGHVKINDRRVSHITLTRDRDEERFSTRATHAVKSFAEGIVTKDRDASRTTEVRVYGSSLAQLVLDKFGRVEGKHVPDWVWTAGEEFATGILLGYLAGDGSKSMVMDARKSGNRITATTIHGSLATQMRDLAASLGWGWASLSRKSGGNLCGRNCKPAFVLSWNGRGAAIARELLGLPVLPKHREKFEYRRYEVADGQAWMQIRKIETDDASVVYDLAVDHPDHTFRTLFFSVSNSEVARWPNGGVAAAHETLRSMRGAVPKRGLTVKIEESTARGGHGAFYDTFTGAAWPAYAKWWHKWADETPQNIASIGGEMQMVRIFAAWFEDDENRIEVTAEQVEIIKNSLDEKELALIARYKTTGPGGERLGDEVVQATLWEQLAWRRSVIYNAEFEGDVEAFEQEYPSSPKEAFASSGKHSFNRAGCSWMVETAKVRPPMIGVLEQQYDGAVTFRRTDASEAWFHLWEEPRVGHRYIQGVDTMAGKSNVKNAEEADYHAAITLRGAHIDERDGLKKPHRVVGALMPKCQYDPDILASRTHLIAKFFGDCMTVPEINNTGHAYRQEAVRLGMKLYRREKTDKFTSEITEYVGWETNQETRPQLIGTLKKYIRNNAKVETREDGIECWSITTAQELSDCVRGDDGKDAAPPSKHDDHMMAIALALQNVESATYFAGHKRKKVPMKTGWRRYAGG